MTTIAKQLEQTGHAQLSTLTKKGITIELHIETCDNTDDLNWKETQSLIGDSYEMIINNSTLEEDLTYNIQNVDGKIFRVNTNQPTVTFRYISILTDRDEDGGVIVPDEPYDKGECKLSDGIYHVYEVRKE